MPLVRFFHFLYDFLVTAILWIYFLFGYLIILPLMYLPVYLFTGNPSAALQKLNNIHLKFFFALARFIIPRTKFSIPEDVRQIGSSVIVCNHLSYLDPILLVSIFPRQMTIVKQAFFKVPVFGWFLKKYGYLSSGSDKMFGAAMINNLEDIKSHLVQGGVLFVFPEGTRSRDGRLGPFNKGVFTIARYCNAPLKLIYISGTGKLFPRGHVLFNAHAPGEIKLDLIGALNPDYKSPTFSMSAVADEARNIFEDKIAKNT